MVKILGANTIARLGKIFKSNTSTAVFKATPAAVASKNIFSEAADNAQQLLTNKAYKIKPNDPIAYEIIYNCKSNWLKEHYSNFPKELDELIEDGFRYEINKNGEKVLVTKTDFFESDSHLMSQNIKYAGPSGNMYDAQGSLMESETKKEKWKRFFSNIFKGRSRIHETQTNRINFDDMRVLSKLRNEAKNDNMAMQQYIETKYGELSPELKEIAEAKVRATFEKMDLVDGEFKRCRPNIFPHTYYRGVRDKKVTEEFLKKAKVGEIITPDYGYAFVSSKLLYDVKFYAREGILFKMKTPSGTKVSTYDELWNQRLLPRAASFKVLGIKKLDIKELGETTQVTLKMV